MNGQNFKVDLCGDRLAYLECVTEEHDELLDLQHKAGVGAETLATGNTLTYHTGKQQWLIVHLQIKLTYHDVHLVTTTIRTVGAL